MMDAYISNQTAVVVDRMSLGKALHVALMNDPNFRGISKKQNLVELSFSMTIPSGYRLFIYVGAMDARVTASMPSHLIPLLVLYNDAMIPDFRDAIQLPKSHVETGRDVHENLVPDLISTTIL
ncbi:hypothetical protein ACLOJK_033081 [Asimina triloba]